MPPQSRKRISRFRSLSRSVSSSPDHCRLRNKNQRKRHSRSSSNHKEIPPPRRKPRYQVPPTSSSNALKRRPRPDTYRSPPRQRSTPFSQPPRRFPQHRVNKSFVSQKPFPRKPLSPEFWTHDRFVESNAEKTEKDKKKLVNLYAETFDQLYVDSTEKEGLHV